MNIDKENRDKLRELAEKALQGPWQMTEASYRDGFVSIDSPAACHYCFAEVAVRVNDEHYEKGANTAAFIAAANPATILALLDMIDRPAASGDDFAFSRNDDYGAYQIIDKEGRHVGDIFDHKTMTEFVRIHTASAERAPVVGLQVVNGELCYKSDEDDQSYGMWCPVTPGYKPPYPNGTKFYAAANGEQK